LAKVKAQLSEYLDKIGKEGPLVVTRHGRPAAVILTAPDDPEDLDSLLLAYDPRFWDVIHRSEGARTLSQDEFWRRAEARYGPYPRGRAKSTRSKKRRRKGRGGSG
jgi:prevent-host-death family protein